jgi:hypothetical protein
MSRFHRYWSQITDHTISAFPEESFTVRTMTVTSKNGFVCKCGYISEL